jgi:hypothetical protein
MKNPYPNLEGVHPGEGNPHKLGAPYGMERV